MNVNVISVRKTPSLTPGRIGLEDALVTFQVEGQGSDFIVMPKADPTAAEIQAAIKAKVTARHASEGQNFEV